MTASHPGFVVDAQMISLLYEPGSSGPHRNILRYVIGYGEKLTGTIQAVMLKDGRTWKIDTLTSPEITHLALW